MEPAKTLLTIALALALRAEPAKTVSKSVFVPVHGTAKDDLGERGEVWMQSVTQPVFSFRQLSGERSEGPIACDQRNMRRVVNKVPFTVLVFECEGGRKFELTGVAF